MTDPTDTWATVGFDRRPTPSVYIQWKGTDVCLDFGCTCGYGGHFDGMFAYGLRCAQCGTEWLMPHSFGLLSNPDGVVQDTDLPHRDDRETTEVAYLNTADDDEDTEQA